jgi:hypothetical protein
MSWENRLRQLEILYGGPNGKANMERDAREYQDLGLVGRFFHIASGKITSMSCEDNNIHLDSEDKNKEKD